jgi:histidyl-tRNA synthetase
MSFDMSLARGLDYYTGIIYEAVHQYSAPPGIKTQPVVSAEASTSAPSKAATGKKSGEEEEVDESAVGVGSIAAGGRYDELVGMFSEAAGGKRGAGKVPCVGISVGVERVYSIILQKRKEKEEREARGKETEVYIVSMGGNGLLKERMALAKDLWDGGIKVSLVQKRKFSFRLLTLYRNVRIITLDRPNSCTRTSLNLTLSWTRVIEIRLPSPLSWDRPRSKRERPR